MSSDDQDSADLNERFDDDEELKPFRALKQETTSAGGERVDGSSNKVPGDIASLHVGSAEANIGGAGPTDRTVISETAGQPAPAGDRVVGDTIEGSSARSKTVDTAHSTTPTPQTLTSRTHSDEAAVPTSADDNLQLEPQSGVSPLASASDGRKPDSVAADTIDVAQGEVECFLFLHGRISCPLQDVMATGTVTGWL